MQKYFLYTLILFASCKSQPGSGSEFDKADPGKTYKLQLNPAAGTAYYYDITNESEIKLEVDDKKVTNASKAVVGVNYKVNKDSSGNFLFSVVYDKIQIHTKTGDKETDADAANAASSIDPVEKVLGLLKAATIVTTIKPNGEIVSIKGYSEISEKIMTVLSPGDEMSANQLFKIFPDTAVRLNDSWDLVSEQEGDFKLLVKSHYTLKAINKGITIVSCEGKISSDNSVFSMPGLAGNTSATLNGNQQGEFEMETETGMIISYKVKATVVGSIQAMGRVIPVKITSDVNMKGIKTDEKK
jgi:hypothetical protein